MTRAPSPMKFHLHLGPHSRHPHLSSQVDSLSPRRRLRLLKAFGRSHHTTFTNCLGSTSTFSVTEELDARQTSTQVYIHVIVPSQTQPLPQPIPYHLVSSLRSLPLEEFPRTSITSSTSLSQVWHHFLLAHHPNQQAASAMSAKSPSLLLPVTAKDATPKSTSSITSYIYTFHLHLSSTLSMHPLHPSSSFFYFFPPPTPFIHQLPSLGSSTDFILHLNPLGSSFHFFDPPSSSTLYIPHSASTLCIHSLHPLSASTLCVCTLRLHSASALCIRSLHLSASSNHFIHPLLAPAPSRRTFCLHLLPAPSTCTQSLHSVTTLSLCNQCLHSISTLDLSNHILQSHPSVTSFSHIPQSLLPITLSGDFRSLPPVASYSRFLQSLASFTPFFCPPHYATPMSCTGH